MFELSFAKDPDMLDELEGFTDTWERSLMPGEQLIVKVTFSPQGDDPVEAILAIITNDPVTPRKEIRIKGNVDAKCARLVGPLIEPITSKDRNMDETHQIDFNKLKQMEELSAWFTVSNCSDVFPLQVSSVSLSGEGSPTSEYFTIEDEKPFVLQPKNGRSIRLFHKPGKEIKREGVLTVKTDAASSPDFRVQLLGVSYLCERVVGIVRLDGNGSLIEKGNPVRKGTSILLSALLESGAEISEQLWSMKSKPTGSASALVEQDRGATFLLDAVGVYVFEATVKDKYGRFACGTEEITLIVPESADIDVELRWKTPADNNRDDGKSADLDLYYIHQNSSDVWNDVKWSVFGLQLRQDWGVIGDSTDDPMLSEDRKEFGPETLIHEKPETGSIYSVGVYYQEDEGFGASYAEVKIFLRGNLVYQSPPTYMEKEGLFWYVGKINWSQKNFLPRNQIGPSSDFIGVGP